MLPTLFGYYFVTNYVVHAWRRKVGFGGGFFASQGRICILTVFASCTLCPISELAGFYHSSYYFQNNTSRQSQGTEQVHSVLFLDPTLMYSNT